MMLSTFQYSVFTEKIIETKELKQICFIETET